MKLAILSDIHGNLIALNTVLKALEAEKPDQFVCLGDVATTGPHPHEVIQQLRELNFPVVMGNTDAFLLTPQDHSGDDPDLKRFTEMDRWCAEQLSGDDRAYLQGFQPSLSIMLEDIEVLCFHGSPGSSDDIITATTSDEHLKMVFEGQTATILAGGHTHQQLLRRYQTHYMINPGSIGMPYEIRLDGTVYNPGWAEYAIVTCREQQVSVELRRIQYDVKPLVEAILASGMPHAEWLVQGWQS